MDDLEVKGLTSFIKYLSTSDNRKSPEGSPEVGTSTDSKVERELNAKLLALLIRGKD